ncbi:MAG: malonate transporter subunit MadM, partial [Lewinella sp.]
MTDILSDLLIKNGLIFAFLVVGVILAVSFWIARRVLGGIIPGVALAIIVGLILAFVGGERGIASYPLFSGMALLGGSMLRDFAVVATATGADPQQMKHAGPAGAIALLIGVVLAFIIGVLIAFALG